MLIKEGPGKILQVFQMSIGFIEIYSLLAKINMKFHEEKQFASHIKRNICTFISLLQVNIHPLQLQNDPAKEPEVQIPTESGTPDLTTTQHSTERTNTQQPCAHFKVFRNFSCAHLFAFLNS